MTCWCYFVIFGVYIFPWLYYEFYGKFLEDSSKFLPSHKILWFTLDSKMTIFWTFFPNFPEKLLSLHGIICNLRSMIRMFKLHNMCYWLLKNCELMLHKAAIYKTPLKRYVVIVSPGTRTPKLSIKTWTPKMGPRIPVDQNFLNSINSELIIQWFTYLKVWILY